MGSAGMMETQAPALPGLVLAASESDTKAERRCRRELRKRGLKLRQSERTGLFSVVTRLGVPPGAPIGDRLEDIAAWLQPERARPACVERALS
jgi:hypothetical protein